MEWMNGVHRHEPRRETTEQAATEESARKEFLAWLKSEEFITKIKYREARWHNLAIRLEKTASFHPVDWVLTEDGDVSVFVEYKRRYRDSQELLKGGGEFWIDLYKLCSLEMLTRMTEVPWWLLVEYNDGQKFMYFSKRGRIYPTRFLYMESLPMGAIGGFEFKKYHTHECLELIQKELGVFTSKL